MKTKRYNIITDITKIVILILLLGTSFYSCKDDNGDPMPVVNNFRVVAKDSSITEGAFGLYIAIQGHNLQNVQEVWFNDLKAYINPNFVTSSNIICAIPSTLPGAILNQVKLVTKGGQTLNVDFKVVLPKPILKGLYNEMATAGSTTKVLGDYLYFIKSVKFGAADAEIVTYSEHEIIVKVPESAKAGDFITVEGEGGITVSSFKLQDPGIWLADYDKPATTWNNIWCWGSSMDKYRTDDESINKNYGYVEGKVSANEEYLGSTCWNYPTQVTDMDLTGKVLKFEVKVKEPWVWSNDLKPEEQATLSFAINEMWDNAYNFRPQTLATYKAFGFTTDGWMTVTVPLSTMGIAGVTTINNIRVTFKPNKQSYDKFSTYFDNFRICTPVVSEATK